MGLLQGNNDKKGGQVSERRKSKQHKTQQESNTMSQRSRGGTGTKGRKTTAAALDNDDFQEKVADDLGEFKDEIDRIDNKITGEIKKMKEWNGKQDENITQLLDRVGKLEGDETKEEEPRSVDEIVKEKMNAFVSDQLEQIVVEKIGLFMKGEEIMGKVGKIVKGLLGAKDQQGKIVSVAQLSARGNLRSVKELESDEKNFYKMRVYKCDCLC
jgi:hypothetical protein